MVRDQTRANLCLADFIAPKSSGVADYIGLFAVTAGLGIDEKLAEFEEASSNSASFSSMPKPAVTAKRPM